MKILSVTLCAQISLALLGLLAKPALGADYIVDPHGSDKTGDGSYRRPWRTIAHAASQIAADRGHVIRLYAKTYEEPRNIVLPSGVSLVGKGRGTVVRVGQHFDVATQRPTGYDDLGNPYFDPMPEQFAISMSGRGVIARGFTLDGQQNRAHGGIRATVVRDAVFEHLHIEGFNFSGLWVHEAHNTEIRHSVFKNNAWANNARAFGNIMYFRGKGLRIHHNTIVQEKDDYEAYGMCSYSQARRVFFGPTKNPRPIPGESKGLAILENADIHHNRIVVPSMGGWRNRTAEAISIETNGVRIVNMRIHHNWANNHISITPGNGNRPNDPTAGAFSCRIDHNTIDLGLRGERRYAIEANAPNMVIDHNYIVGGQYPIAQWQGKRGAFYKNHKIHHNVFYAPRGGFYLIRYRQYPTGFWFVNNTVVDIAAKGLKGYFKPNDDIPDGVRGAMVRNNIFLRLGTPNTVAAWPEDTFYRPDARNNLFYHMRPFGGWPRVVGSTKQPASILRLSGQKPWPYFALSGKSPAYRAGVYTAGLGLSRSPDIGAYAYHYASHSPAVGAPERVGAMSGAAPALPSGLARKTTPIATKAPLGPVWHGQRLCWSVPGSDEEVVLRIFDTHGRAVLSTSGSHGMACVPSTANSGTKGLYIVSIETKRFRHVQRVVLW